MQRPTGVTAIAVVFLLIAACLGGIGVVILVSPDAVSMTRGAPLLHGLELGGPYAALLVGAAWALIGWRLLRLYDWARLAAMLVIISGVGVLVARFAPNASRFRSSLVWEGLEVFMRVAVVWYLFRTPVAEQFSKSARATYGRTPSSAQSRGALSDGPCKQQIPRTLSPRERSCERLGMTRNLVICKSK